MQPEDSSRGAVVLADQHQDRIDSCGSEKLTAADERVSAEALCARFHKPFPRKRREGTAGALRIWEHTLSAADERIHLEAR